MTGMNAGQIGEFPQTDTTVVLKEDAALDAVKDVTCCADGASS